MNFVDLKCPNCGGKLIPVEGNQKIVACEYCSSQYILEDDRVINYHIHQYATPADHASGTTGSADRSGMLAAAGILLGVAVLFGVGIGLANKERLTYSSILSQVEEGEEEESEEEIFSHSPFYDTLVEGIYQKPSDLVGAEEREKLKYLSIRTGRDNFYVDYSFEDPYQTAEYPIEHLELVPADWDTDDLAEFPQLLKIELSYSWADGEVLRKLKNLKGLSCHGTSPGELVQWIEPGQLTELHLDGPESLEGLPAFENLEILSLKDVAAPDVRQLAPLTRLHSLEIEEKGAEHDPFSDEPSNHMTDYSAIAMLTSLKSLHLESEAIRDVTFLKSLTNLKDLSLKDTEAISMESLAELSQLTMLELADNNSLKDYNFIPALSGLKKLTLDKSTSQPDPELAALGQLEELDISGLMSVAQLGRLGSLRDLSLHGCNVDEISALSSLTGLECLSCYSVWTYAVPLRNVSFIDKMTNLKCLNFGGNRDGWSGYGYNMEIYGDISNVLNHTGLEEIYLNDCMFGIDFDKLQENPSLKNLQMEKVNLKKDFHVETSSGMTDIWYDDVALDEHTEFLKLYPNLEELHLDGNQLTNVRFATGLKRLLYLSVSNNYITDLAPLNQAESLKYLDVRQNPVNNMIEMGEDVRVLK